MFAHHELPACESCKLREPGMFCDLSPEAMATFTEDRQSSTYPAGAFLFFEKEANRGIYILCSGQIKLSVSSSGGKTLILKLARPGEILGLSSTLLSQPYEASAEVLQTARVVFLRREDLLQLTCEYPQIHTSLLRQLNLQYQTACEQLRTIALSGSATEKLARLLMHWATQGKKTRDGIQITIPLTHEQIAECVGATRETITRTLSDFKHRQLIACHGTNLLIPNPAALAAIGGD
jgi:CRP/FNR family transcriptional regulator, cyclic AMP receptor protein